MADARGLRFVGGPLELDPPLPGLAVPMTEQLQIHLSGADRLVADLELLAQAAERSLEVRNALVDFFGGVVQASGVDIQQRPATEAGELWVEAKLCDRLAALAAALRAGDADAL